MPLVQGSWAQKEFYIYCMRSRYWLNGFFREKMQKAIWDKVFKNGPGQIFLKAVFHKFYLVHS